MSYDLIPRNKKIEPITFGAFRWPIILGEVGGVIGFRNREVNGVYRGHTYIPDKRDAGPATNDGFYVAAWQAKAMAAICETIISQGQLYTEELGGPPPGLVEMAKKLRPFAARSQGFWIT